MVCKYSSMNKIFFNQNKYKEEGDGSSYLMLPLSCSYFFRQNTADLTDGGGGGGFVPEV